MPPAPVEGQVGLTAEQLRKRQVADELAEYGMVETLSYPFVGDEDYKNFALDVAETKNVSVEIANPLAVIVRSCVVTLFQRWHRPFSAIYVAAWRMCRCMRSATCICGIRTLRRFRHCRVQSSRRTSSLPRLMPVFRTSRCMLLAF